MAELPFREVYEVGGSLRDELLGRAPKDVDFLVRGHDVEELLDALPRARPRRGAARRRAARGRALLAAIGARARGSRSCRRGARRRSRRASRATPATRTATSASSPTPSCPCATTSSGATSPSTRWRATCARGEWIDPFGGRDDLRAGVLRAVHATAFRDDPLRILRGVARCSIDGLQPDAATRELMAAAAPRIAELSAERVREELDRTLEGDGAAAALRLARDVGRARGRAARVGGRPSATTSISDLSATRSTSTILHVLEAAVQDGATPRAAAGGAVARRRQAGSRRARATTPRPARASPAGALRRLTYDNDTVAVVTALVREHSYREDREPSPRAARVFLRARGARARPRSAGPAPLGSHRAAACRSRPSRCERARASRSSSSRSGVSRWRSPTWPCAATTCWRRACPRGPRSGATLRRLLAAVVDDPSLNERETLLRLARR